MKLITLNIWGGIVRDPLLEFISLNKDIDIFCFQEVYHQAPKKISSDDKTVSLNIFSDIQSILSGHRGFFRPVVNNIYGISAFVKEQIEVLEEGESPIHENPNYPGAGPTHRRNLQWLHCRSGKTEFTVINVHGLWNGRGKTDSPERLAQAERIRIVLDGIKRPKILCGDFNLRPDTESLKIIEKGLQNWVSLHRIQSTRTSLYTKEERFADYVFTSPELEVHHFEVLSHEVSDHAPLLLHFS